MRAAAIDLGTVRVGLAVADELGMLAHPRPHLDGRDPGRLVDALRRIIEVEQIEVVLVGHPRQLSGAEGRQARKARAFAERLAEACPVRVELFDERLTTREASARLRAQGLSAREARPRVDSAAAAVMLQAWLDQQDRTR